MDEKETLEKVAHIAKLHLDNSEKDMYSKDLKNILEAFSSIDEVNVDDIEPAFQPIKIKDRTRKDTIEPSLTQEDALANTKNKKDGYFTGPKAI